MAVPCRNRRLFRLIACLKHRITELLLRAGLIRASYMHEYLIIYKTHMSPALREVQRYDTLNTAMQSKCNGIIFDFYTARFHTEGWGPWNSPLPRNLEIEYGYYCVLFVPDCVRSNLRGSKFKIFPGRQGGICPLILLVATHATIILLPSSPPPNSKPCMKPCTGLSRMVI